MSDNHHSIRRPALYFIAAALGIALVIPLAISTGQTQTAGIFDECYEAACDAPVLFADARK